MAGGNVIRGSRVGAGPMGEDERGTTVARRQVLYYCSRNHVSSLYFAEDAEVPQVWDCSRCGLPASRDRDNPPPAPRVEPYKSHLAYVKERRSEDESVAILDEALAALRQRRQL